MSLKKNKVLLIEPPFYRLFKETYALERYPLSLAYLAGETKAKTDWEVTVYNADFRPHSETLQVGYLLGAGFASYLQNLGDLSRPIWREIESTLSEYAPDVVGISAKSQNFASALNVARLAKQASEQTVVILGGPHTSMVGVDVLAQADVDIGVIGEGEGTLVELLTAIGGSREIDRINGIVFRKGDGILQTPPREYIRDLDSLSFPHQGAREVLKDYAQYPRAAFQNILATRGCPHNCFFCGSREIWGRQVRFRSPENVVQEIEGLQRLGLKTVHFDDDTFGVNRKYIRSLCDALTRQCPELGWSCELHVNLVDSQTLSLMKTAGCRSIQLGVESGSNEILSAMRKGFTIEEALRACEIIKKLGIELQVFFMIGFPQETESTVNDTLAAMERVKCDTIIYSIFTPYPGTEAFKFCRDNGLIDDEFEVSLYNHQSPANCFCLHIQPERFKALVADVARRVDRRNTWNRTKRLFSRNAIRRARNVGIREAFRKGLGVLRRK